eukprot:scaffold1806_cov240-Pinguiococcus_pyrenoidosus.AAC.34
MDRFSGRTKKSAEKSHLAVERARARGVSRMRALWPAAFTLLRTGAALRPLFGSAAPDMSRIIQAKEKFPPLFFPTPLLESPKLSEEVGTRVLLKMDALQPSGSFKDRGMAIAWSAAEDLWSSASDAAQYHRCFARIWRQRASSASSVPREGMLATVRRTWASSWAFRSR